MALVWFKSYLCGRHQKIKIDKSFSDSSLLEHGVPQGSVLGPLLFCLYTAPLSTIISSYGLSHHLFEKIHLKLCKSVLGVHAKASNDAVRGELGRRPIIFFILK